MESSLLPLLSDNTLNRMMPDSVENAGILQ
jgi:hypothetical protein